MEPLNNLVEFCEFIRRQVLGVFEMNAYCLHEKYNNGIDALQARPTGQRQNSARLFRDSLWNGAEIKNPKQSLGLNWLR